jgi:hypothetical protein
MQELLKPKQGWNVIKLGDIADVVGGGTPSTFNSTYWNGEVNWFTPTEIGERKYTFQSIRKITKEQKQEEIEICLPVFFTGPSCFSYSDFEQLSLEEWKEKWGKEYKEWREEERIRKKEE